LVTGADANGTPSALLIANDLRIGREGSGTVSISAGGGVVATDVILGDQPGSFGQITVDGTNSLLSAINVRVANDGIAMAIVKNGGAIAADTIFVGRHGSVSGNGRLIVTRRVINGGTIAPGLSPGHLTIEGDYEQLAGGALLLEVAGLTPDAYDILDITGNATFDGQVVVNFENGFAPHTGDRFDFLNVAGTISGTLPGVSIQGLADGFLYDADLANGHLSLTALSDGVFVGVPEPAAMALAALSLLLLQLPRCRTRHPKMTPPLMKWKMSSTSISS
jgi:T5SS/PEP-CTERM-associated repeat protein